ncbi:MAG: sporulation integral membrane protein YtvI [Oscillospiraceae bacterium]|nr:sporulation integral membrane protein YtvI [Oscillospiraceae bacterium]
MPENKHARLFLTIIYIALGVLAVWLVFKYALPWLAPFIVAFILSRIIEYPVSFFEKKLRFPRPLASLIFTLLIYGVIGTLLYFASSKLVRALVMLFEKLRTLDIDLLVEELNSMFTNILGRFPLGIQDFIYTNIGTWLSELVSALRNLISPIVSYTANIASVLPSILIFVIAAIASTYFLSSDYKTIKSKISEIASDRWKYRYRRTRDQLSDTLLCYLRAVLVLVCITFVELTIGLSVLGVENSILIAAIIAIIDALPVLGTGWIIMPWAIVALCMGNYLIAIGLAVIYAVVTIVRNLIEPKIVGEHIGLHPLATLLSIYIGLKIFGIIGMFTPILVALLKKFYEWGYFDFLKNYRTPPKPLDE